jgi:hypothetical protein
VNGNTSVAAAEDGVPAVLAVDGGAAGPGRALVAGEGGVSKVPTPRALHQVAADAGHVPHLRRSAGQQRLGQGREAGPESGQLGDVAHPGQRADPRTVRADVGQPERQAVDVDQQRVADQAVLDPVEQLGAARDEGRVRLTGGEGDGRGDVADTGVAKGVHRLDLSRQIRRSSGVDQVSGRQACWATSRIAATMFG